jgi:glycerophosphoryl diester phosphodiesterase
LLKTLSSFGMKDKEDPVFIQSFEVDNLKSLRGKTRLRLVQLVASEGGPADGAVASYGAMLTAEGFAGIAAYADAIGAEKSLVIPRTGAGDLSAPTGLVAQAHKAGLKVHVWTFRPENYFLPNDLRVGDSPLGRGDAEAEIRRFLDAGIDGLFSDSVGSARAAMEARTP